MARSAMFAHGLSRDSQSTPDGRRSVHSNMDLLASQSNLKSTHDYSQPHFINAKYSPSRSSVVSESKKLNHALENTRGSQLNGLNYDYLSDEVQDALKQSYSRKELKSSVKDYTSQPSQMVTGDFRPSSDPANISIQVYDRKMEGPTAPVGMLIQD